MYGVEVYYIPRQYLTKNTVIEEVIQSEFTSAYPIEAYVNNYDGYDGQGTLLSKFGITDLDDLTLIISKERYEQYITPLIRDLPNIELATRPKEGDLIYFPFGDRLFEIKFVEHEQPFYQLQKTYVYELRCELFRYSTEVVNTGIDKIDDNFTDQGYIQTFTTAGIGETAAAYAGIVDGALSGTFYFSDTGYGYTKPVTVAISTAPVGGVNASGIVTGRTTYGSGGAEFLTIQGVELVNPGAGYTIAPTLAIKGYETGVGAAATVGIVTMGAVGFVTVTSVGANFVEVPTVTFSAPPGAGTTATGRVILASDNTVSAVRITNVGSGYTVAPSITFGQPNLVATGNFEYNEEVLGLASQVTGRVKSWNVGTRKLRLSNLSGDFVNGELVIGQTSGARHKIVILNTISDNPLVDDNTYDVPETSTSVEETNPSSSYDENVAIQSEGDDLLDFTERNPFGRV